MRNMMASEEIALLAVISPASLPAAAADTGWVSAKNFSRFMGIVQTGVLGAAATVDVKFQQATSAAGAGAKDVAGTSATQLVKATDDNKQVVVNLYQEDLDIKNKFTHIRLVVTVAAAASLGSAVLLGVGSRQLPASKLNAATVAQVVV